MKKALVVGINFYENVGHLYGCVDDAYAMHSVLTRNSDDTINFDVRLLTGTSVSDIVSRKDLYEQIEELFTGDSEISLFYFSGHGCVENTGGSIIASDYKNSHDGISLNEIMTLANKSPSNNRIIVLDSCFSGIAGAAQSNNSFSELREGTTILTASTSDQYASESNGSGIFTALFVDAMKGAAANLLGDITPGSVYAHIDQSLGPWDQRPVFKTNVKSFVSLRKVNAPISLQDLRRIIEFFPVPGYEFKLDPTYEPEREAGRVLPPPDPTNTNIFAILQKYNRVNLLIPIDAPHMWHAAIYSKSCKLTALGEHYRKLIERGRI